MLRPAALFLTSVFLASMMNTRAFILFLAGTAVLSCPVHAAGPKRVDPMLKQAIEKTAEQEVETVEAVPPETVEPEPPAAEKPVPKFLETKTEMISSGSLRETDKAEAPPEVAKKDLFAQPDGYRWSGLRFMPQLGLSTAYNDNVFATENNEDGDFVTSVKPYLHIETLGEKHVMNIDLAYEYRRYADNEDESRHNFSTRLHGYLGAIEGLTMPYDFGWSKKHAEREDNLAGVRPDEPLLIDTFHTSIGVAYQGSKGKIGFYGDYRKERYDDGPSSPGGRVIRRDADRDIVALRAEVEGQVTDYADLVIGGKWSERDYQRRSFQNGGFNGPSRSSDVIEGLGGFRFNGGRLSGHVKAGYASYSYDDKTGTIDDIGDILVDAALRYPLPGESDLNVSYRRDIYEDDDIIQPIVHDRFGVSVDRAVREDILLGIGADYALMDFESSNREDKRFSFRLLADYFISRYLAFGAEYEYATRDSDAALLDFDRNLFMVRLNGRL